MRLRKYLSIVGSLSSFVSGRLGLNFNMDSVMSEASVKTHRSVGSKANSAPFVKVLI
jgi:hypothetical protein